MGCNIAGRPKAGLPLKGKHLASYDDTCFQQSTQKSMATLRSSGNA